ncbi:hypothetical protein ETD86_23120 [Nonomuraea turkmeniaca]|uniref:Uncharacterized protein n=1 Tax=Nonomuraea turkmeniaca TaxID=103838 RepID=A0A5S4FF55_9ACTN|nr:hypothetical protein [Nonomuraea turkmeniaca]TMR17520.1 hypothetical protein ETD86_23120 [Nonomuraea turkmeniaca]
MTLRDVACRVTQRVPVRRPNQERLGRARACAGTRQLERLSADADFDYRVGGTSAALLQGVHLPVGDIDLLVAGREDVDTFAAALEAYPCLYPASWIQEAMQYFARYEINGSPGTPVGYGDPPGST